MREKANQVRYEEDQYHAGESYDSSMSEKRLDLNDLLKRAKDQEKNDKKLNLLIYAGAASIHKNQTAKPPRTAPKLFPLPPTITITHIRKVYRIGL